jgi:hypothetical protein
VLILIAKFNPEELSTSLNCAMRAMRETQKLNFDEYLFKDLKESKNTYYILSLLFEWETQTGKGIEFIDNGIKIYDIRKKDKIIDMLNDNKSNVIH